MVGREEGFDEALSEGNSLGDEEGFKLGGRVLASSNSTTAYPVKSL